MNKLKNNNAINSIYIDESLESENFMNHIEDVIEDEHYSEKEGLEKALMLVLSKIDSLDTKNELTDDELIFLDELNDKKEDIKKELESFKKVKKPRPVDSENSQNDLAYRNANKEEDFLRSENGMSDKDYNRFFNRNEGVDESMVYKNVVNSDEDHVEGSMSVTDLEKLFKRWLLNYNYLQRPQITFRCMDDNDIPTVYCGIVDQRKSPFMYTIHIISIDRKKIKYRRPSELFDIRRFTEISYEDGKISIPFEKYN